MAKLEIHNEHEQHICSFIPPSEGAPALFEVKHKGWLRVMSLESLHRAAGDFLRLHGKNYRQATEL